MKFILRYINLLPQNEKKKLPPIISEAIVRRLLELVGLASFLPAIFVLVGPLSSQTSQWLLWVKPFLGDLTPRLLGLWLCGAALLFLPFKAIVSAILSRNQTRYLMGVYRSVSNRTFTNYLEQGLSFIKKSHSSDLTYHVNGLSYAYSSMVGMLVEASGELFLTLVLIGLVLYSSPGIMALLLLCIVPPAFVYGRYLKRRMGQMGKRLIETKREQTRVVQDAFRGFVSMQVDNYFTTVWRRYQGGIDEIADQTEKMQLLGRIPNALIEILVALVLLILIFFDPDQQSVFKPIYVVFGFAALRLLPSMLSLLNSWSLLQSNMHLIDRLEKDNLANQSGNLLAKESSETKCFERSIEIENLSFCYQSGQFVLKDFNLTIRKGETIGVVGPSGVGKSTLFYLIMGFYKPYSGSIRVDGEILDSKNCRQWQQIIGVVEQTLFLNDDSLLRNIVPDISVEPDMTRIQELLEKVGLYDWAMSLPMGLQTTLGESGCLLSGGQRQRIAIVRALYKGPQILFFDEATSSLDERNERDIVNLLTHLSLEEHITLMIIAHRRSTLTGCDRLIEVPNYETNS